ncbi:MAG: GGDEF domain-containing protein [Burkholderiaceae bacterium]|nr:GGDEF domain-containing protein [Burkholderiaceae bacterium]
MLTLVWVQALGLVSIVALGGWALAAGPLRIVRRASRDVAVFNALVAVGALAWLPLPGLDALPPAHRLALGLALVLAGVQWLCMGMHRLHDTRHAYVLSPLMLPGLAVLLAVVAWLDGSGHGLTLAALGACVWLLGVSLQQVYPSVTALLGVRGAQWALMPVVLVAVVWLLGMVRAVWMLANGVGGAGGVAGAAGAAAVPLDVWHAVGWVLTSAMLNATMVGMVLLKLIDKIRELSTEDEVTGALNMRSFMAMLANERERLRRTPQPQSLMLCDLDQYPALNRQLGFAAGDAALRHVTAVIGRTLRKTDRLGRTPEGELALFMPATPAVGATLVAERTQAAVKANPLLWNGQSVSLTLSMGLSSRESPAVPCEALLEASRQSMARASREGGARVRVAARFDAVESAPAPTPPQPAE